MKKFSLSYLILSSFIFSSIAIAGEITCVNKINLKANTKHSRVTLVNKNDENNYYFEYNTGACDRCDETLEFSKDGVIIGHNGDDATYSIDGQNLFVIHNKRNVIDSTGASYTKAVFYYKRKNLDFYCVNKSKN